MKINRKTQSGLATIVFSVFLLEVMMLVALVSGNNTVIETRVSNNDLAEQYAFEAAQAGSNMFTILLSNSFASFDVDTTGDGQADTTLSSDAILVDNNPADGRMDDYTSPWVFLDNNGGYQLTITDETPGASGFSLLRLSATGMSDDGRATRTIDIMFGADTVTLGSPNSAILALGDVEIGNHADITNLVNNLTLWIGDELDAGNNVDFNTSIPGVDGIVEEDASLQNLTDEELFQLVFGASIAEVQSTVTHSFTGDGDYSDELDGLTNSVIWIDTENNDASIGTHIDIGTADEPVLLIVDGDFDIGNHTDIYGSIVVLGDLEISNHANVVGSIVASGEIEIGNHADVTYNLTVNESLPTQSMTYATIPGSWSDF